MRFVREITRSTEAQKTTVRVEIEVSDEDTPEDFTRRQFRDLLYTVAGKEVMRGTDSGD